jgi:tetratricopeptide (TPR) repeat protein
MLRTARALALARIPAHRVRRALRKLTRELPQGRSLSELRITAENGKIVVRDGSRTWNPESGQLQLDFRVSRRGDRGRPRIRQKVKPVQEIIPLHPRNADEHVNLGFQLYEQDQVAEAVSEYRKALGLKRNHPIAAFNLGIALEDLGQTNDAIVAYRRAVEADPFFADAHYNLALLYQKSGKKTAAIRHLKTYRELKKDGKTERRKDGRTKRP